MPSSLERGFTVDVTDIDWAKPPLLADWQTKSAQNSSGMQNVRVSNTISLCQGKASRWRVLTDPSGCPPLNSHLKTLRLNLLSSS